MKSAVLARAVRRRARHRLLVALRCASRWRGRSTPRCTIRAAAACTHRDETRTSCRSTSACSSRSASASPRRSFRSIAVESRGRREDAERGRRPLRAAQSRRGLAEQAVAAGALRRRRGRAARRARLPSVVLWGPGEEALADDVVAGVGAAPRCSRRRRRSPIVVALVARRGADGVGRHRARRTSPPPSARRSSASTGRRGPTRNGPWPPRRRHRVARRRSASATTCGGARLETMCLLDIQVDEVHGGGRAPARSGRARMPDAGLARAMTGSSHLARLRVALGFVCGVAGALAGRADARRRLLVGLAVARRRRGASRIWAAGHLNKSREVTASGPYVGRASALCRLVDHGRRPGGRVGQRRCRRRRRGVLAVTLTAAIRSEEAFLRRAFGGRLRRSTADRRRGHARTRFSLAQAMAQPRVPRRGRVVLAVVVAGLKATYNGAF